MKFTNENREQVLLEYARSFNLESFLGELRGIEGGEYCASRLGGFLPRASSLRCEDFGRELLEDPVFDGAAMRDIAVMDYAVSGMHGPPSPAEVTELQAVIRARTQDVFPHAALRILEAHSLRNSGDFQEALKILDGTLGLLLGVEDEDRIGAEILRHLCYMQKAEVLKRMGDFHVANQCLQSGLSISTEWSFGILQFASRFKMADLLWQSGQVEEALTLHRDPVMRDALRLNSLSVRLLRSHLAACKCAIDAQKIGIAREELEAAKELIVSEAPADQIFLGHCLLFGGQIAFQEQRFDASLSLFNQAEAYYENLDPPHQRGVMDAKIAQAHFALFEGKKRLFFQILQKLLEESEQQGCLEARSRLLLLEAYLYFTEDPPLQEAYEKTVERVHLINNPALLFKALSFLYNYALRHRGDREQAFLLTRLHAIRPLLEESCFDGLYKEYVTDRYQSAIEERLARLLETEEGQIFGEETTPEE